MRLILKENQRRVPRQRNHLALVPASHPAQVAATKQRRSLLRKRPQVAEVWLLIQSNQRFHIRLHNLRPSPERL